MKKIKISTLFLLAVVTMASCVSAPSYSPQPKGITNEDIDTVSFTIGVYLAKMVSGSDLGDLDLGQIVKGYKSAITDVDDALYDQTFIDYNMSGFIAKRSFVLGEENRLAGEAFLAEIDKEEGVVKTESGLRYKVVNPGSEVKPVSDQDVVTVLYEGKTIDGEIFDSTYTEGEEAEPVTFPLNRVIAGWTEGLKYVGEGGEIMLYIPSELGYGAYGPMGPNQVLIFKVELKSVEFAEPTE